ncbi:MAG: 5-bromo-4-chloroindolyl phosphate hydrolysis family protein [Gemmiger sp.]
MPNHPYTDPNHPYTDPSHSAARRNAPFQFPWWAILIGFVTWWPLGLIFIGVNEFSKRNSQPRATAPKAAPANRAASQPVYAQPQYAPPTAPQAAARKAAPKDGAGGEWVLYIVGLALVAVGALALPEGLFWLEDALASGGHYWSWLLEELVPPMLMLLGGAGCLFAGQRAKTSRRMRKKILNIVGDAPYMYIEDIAASIPCSYEKCCQHLENCVDQEVFGKNAYLDMRTRSLVVRGAAPKPEPAPAPAPAPAKEEPADRYQQMLNELRRVNDQIPGEEMSDKISRLETVSGKIFAQTRNDPDKLPQIRKFMDYYLPTALKLLQTYAELEAQGVEGDNIRESKRRIEQVMDTLVVAFENQLDKLFQADALDVSADIDVMQNMLRADGLADGDPFHLQ